MWGTTTTKGSTPLILNLNGSEWFTARPGRFTPKKNTGTH